MLLSSSMSRRDNSPLAQNSYVPLANQHSFTSPKHGKFAANDTGEAGRRTSHHNMSESKSFQLKDGKRQSVSPNRMMNIRSSVDTYSQFSEIRSGHGGAGASNDGDLVEQMSVFI